MIVAAIIHRELRESFSRPIAYVFVASFLILSAVYTFVLNPFFVVGRATLVPFFEFIPFLCILFIPAITMRSFAEERATGMIEILQTWPVTDVQWVLGKYMSSVLLVSIALALTVFFPISVSLIGDIDWGAIVGGYLGVLLLASTYCALGILASTMTANQIVAFICGFLLCFFFFVIGKTAQFFGGEWSSIAEFLSFERRVSAISRGVLDIRDLVFFLSLIGLALGISVERLYSRRWQ